VVRRTRSHFGAGVPLCRYADADTDADTDTDTDASPARRQGLSLLPVPDRDSGGVILHRLRSGAHPLFFTMLPIEAGRPAT
jgi:hypothetical protein